MYNIFFYQVSIYIFLIAKNLHGHFLAAKACGVKVLRFSLGFGPVLFKTMELSSYFRINARNTGQFERTLIIADVRVW